MYLSTNNTNNKLVKKHNELISSRHTLTLIQNRIMALIISKIKREDLDLNRYYTIKVDEMLNSTEIKCKDMYTRIRNEAKNLQSKVYTIKKNNGNIIDTVMISSAEYKKGGVVEFEVPEKLKPYLIQINENFTEYRLSVMLKLKSTYAQRFYELLSRFRTSGWWIVDLEELRWKLALNDKYKGYGMFKKRVLLRSQEDLKDTDMAFEFEESEKMGKLVKKLKFVLKHRGGYVKEEGKEKLYERMTQKFKLSDYQTREILKTVPEQIIGKTLYDIQISHMDGKVRNIAAYTWQTFKNQYPEQLGQQQTALELAH
ncbi:MAG: replication initiation protein [Bacteroidota bacterium]